MGIEEKRAEKIAELAAQITEGWIIYGQYMNKNEADNSIAQEVLAIVRKLEMKKAELTTVDDSAAKDFIRKNGGKND